MENNFKLKVTIWQKATYINFKATSISNKLNRNMKDTNGKQLQTGV